MKDNQTNQYNPKNWNNRERLENNLQDNQEALRSYLEKEAPVKATRGELEKLIPDAKQFDVNMSQDMLAASITNLTQMRDERMGIKWTTQTNQDRSTHIIRD